MKKAKFMLASIAVVAIVGGAFASKAHRQGKVIYGDNGGQSFCTVTIPSASTAFAPGEVTVTLTNGDLVNATANSTAACDETSVYYTDAE